MKLYGHPQSACTRKVLMTLAEKGLEAEFSQVDLRTGEHKHAAHMKRHPFGKIPVLEDGSFVLYESGAIMRYLDAARAADSLTPSSARERGRMEQWLSVEPSYLGPATWILMSQLTIRPLFGGEPDPIEVARGLNEVGEALDVLERELSAREHEAPYLAGPTFSLADIAFMPCFQFLVDARQTALLQARPTLHAWWLRVSLRPTWQKVLDSGRPRRAQSMDRGVPSLLAVAH